MAQSKVATPNNRTWYILIVLVFIIGLLLGLIGGVLVGRETVRREILTGLSDTFNGILDSPSNPELDMTRTAISVNNSAISTQLISELEGTLTALPAQAQRDILNATQTAIATP